MVAPRGLATRPATARVRQSIFSRLQVRMALEGARVLDLYAGSGSLGIEALSRGAASAVFADSSRAAASSIKRNLETLKLLKHSEVIIADVRHALDALATRGAQFDLVFIDPPYADDRSAEILARIDALNLLAPGGWIVVRQAGRAVEPHSAGLERSAGSLMGDHRITLYRRGGAAEHGSETV
jgi:16S rRNA (guanine966-N2)-methyltransferase